MEQEVYVDLYFLINTSMDLLGLMLSAALLHRKVNRWRAILAASLGGLYAVVSLLLLWDGVIGFLTDCLAALMITAVAFPVSRKSAFGKRVGNLLGISAVYVLVSMLLGGVMTALYSALNRLELPFAALQGDGLSVWLFALLTLIAGIVTAKGGRFLGLAQKTKRVTVHAVLFGKPITLFAMVDSGNLCRDPISGKSVIVADLEKLSPILPPELRRACESGNYTGWLSTYQNSRVTRPVPTRTANGESLLLAIVPDRLTLDTGKEVYEASYLIAPAPLGESARGFDALIASD